MAGKGGGAWKVAYADFVTAMMAFFMVMWITAQSKQVKAAVAHYFNSPSKVGAKHTGNSKDPPGETPNDPFRIGATQAGAQAFGPGGIDPGPRLSRAEDPKGGVARRASVFAMHSGDQQMSGTVVAFADDSAELGRAGKERLSDLVPQLVGKRNKVEEFRGHATRRPGALKGSLRDPWQLSYARCVAVMKYLEEKGIEPERIRLSQAGPYEPQTLRLEPDMQGQNARVEVYALGEFAEDTVGTRQERNQRLAAP